MRASASVARLGLLLGLGLLVACGGPEQTPEARVRQALGALEAAAEEGDVAAFKAFVSERYEDAHGHDRQALGRYVAFHVMRNSSRHVVLRVRDVLIVSPGKAEVTVIAGIGGTRGGGGATTLHGNVYQIDVDLEEEDAGEWRLVWAQWKPTAPAELL